MLKIAESTKITGIDTSVCGECHVNPAEHEHTCQFAIEVNGDSDFTCNCCGACESDCRKNIVAGMMIAPKCSKCQQQPARQMHPCPYSQEINDDDTPCNCCLSCSGECAMEI